MDNRGYDRYRLRAFRPHNSCNSRRAQKTRWYTRAGYSYERTSTYGVRATGRAINAPRTQGGGRWEAAHRGGPSSTTDPRRFGARAFGTPATSEDNLKIARRRSTPFCALAPGLYHGCTRRRRRMRGRESTVTATTTGTTTTTTIVTTQRRRRRRRGHARLDGGGRSHGATTYARRHSRGARHTNCRFPGQRFDFTTRHVRARNDPPRARSTKTRDSRRARYMAGRGAEEGGGDTVRNMTQRIRARSARASALVFVLRFQRAVGTLARARAVITYARARARGNVRI